MTRAAPVLLRGGARASCASENRGMRGGESGVEMVASHFELARGREKASGYRRKSFFCYWKLDEGFMCFRAGGTTCIVP
eukprot:5474622-Prymnesium_polylepis.1